MKYEFDAFTRRRGTNCVKWDALPDGETLPMWVADMDFPAAPPIVDALKRRVSGGVFGYALPPPAWRESLAGWLQRRHGWTIAPDSAVEAIGAIAALGAVIRAVCSPGDMVAIQPPVYNCFFSVVRDNGCAIAESPLIKTASRTNGDFSYEMDFNDLERKAADPRVKLFLLCNPHNPAGRCWTPEELERAGGIFRKHGKIVLSDEIHGDLQMPGLRHTPFASLSDDFRENSVSVWSASKTFNLAGLQTAAAICANAPLREKIHAELMRARTGELNALGFEAAMAAWNECEDWLDCLRGHLQGNRDALVSFARERMPRLKISAVEATYLAWADATAAGIPSGELVEKLEREAKVRYSPGAIFGEAAGTSFFRINLACTRDMLLEALERTARTGLFS